MSRVTPPKTGFFAQIGRYLRAFFVTVGYTLRGEKPATLQADESFPNTLAWCRKTVSLIKLLEAHAAAQQIDLSAIAFTLEKRPTTAQRVLDAAKFHASQEFPHVLRHEQKYALLGIQSATLNDRYAVMLLIDHAPDALHTQIAALGDHLAAMPQEAAVANPNP
jgi:hypothetical protein